MQSILNKNSKIYSDKHLSVESLVEKIVLKTLILAELDIKDTMKELIEDIGKFFNCGRCYVRYFDFEQKNFVKADENFEYLKSLELKSFINGNFPSRFFELMNYTKKPELTDGILCLENWQEQFLELHGKTSENINLIKPIIEEYSIKSIYISTLKIGSEIIGSLIIHYTDDFVVLSEEDINYIDLISKKFSYFLRQIMLIKKDKKINEKEILLKQIIKNISDSKDIDKIKDQLVKNIGIALNAARCFICECDIQNNGFLPIKNEYLCSTKIKKLKGKSINSKKMMNLLKQELIIYDCQKYLKENNFGNNSKEALHIKQNDIKSAFLIPIYYEDNCCGIIIVEYDQAFGFDNNDISFVRTVSDHIGIAINQFRLYSSLKKRMEEEKLLSEIMTVIKSNLKLDEIFIIICNLLEQFYKADKIIIKKIDKQEKKLILLKESFKNKKNDFEFSIKTDKYLYKILAKKRNLIINDVTASNMPMHIKKELKSKNINSLMMTPMYIDSKETGAIIIEYNEKKYWDHEDINFLLRIADYVSIAIKESSFYNQSEFISNVSHELKTPLSIISGYANTLLNLEEPDYKIIKKFLTIIKNNSERLNKLIDNLLFISVAGKKTQFKNIVFEKLKASDLIENSIQLCYEKLQSRNIIIEKNIENITIKKANLILLQQLLINLIINAINYSDMNSKIKLSVLKNGKEILISVEDFGYGIKEEHQANIFQRFYRVDKSRSSKTGGTGLGLNISKLISEIHGGYMTLQSIYGKGSIFTLHLPE